MGAGAPNLSGAARKPVGSSEWHARLTAAAPGLADAEGEAGGQNTLALMVMTTALNEPISLLDAAIGMLSAAYPDQHIFASLAHSGTIRLASLLAEIGTLTTLAGDIGYIEEIVVYEAARGQHISTALVRDLLELATRKGMRYVELTSRPSRDAANGLYRSLGFERRDTNCYRHDPSPWT
jgi:ribosomal protein S18 acetylase RimI-like enzyme